MFCCTADPHKHYFEGGHWQMFVLPVSNAVVIASLDIWHRAENLQKMHEDHLKRP